MSEDQVIRHCAPTLAGLKTGNIFNASYENEEELKASLAAFNEILTDRGLRITCLRAGGGRALVYLYRPQSLLEDLSCLEAKALLQQFGYEADDPQSCIDRLAKKISLNESFPHEIGLFLGYPPEDVKGFIDFRGKDCKTCGYWKVYGDAQAAEKRFAQFTKCTGVYMKCLHCGAGLAKLAVRRSAKAGQCKEEQ